MVLGVANNGTTSTHRNNNGRLRHGNKGTIGTTAKTWQQRHNWDNNYDMAAKATMGQQQKHGAANSMDNSKVQYGTWDNCGNMVQQWHMGQQCNIGATI